MSDIYFRKTHKEFFDFVSNTQDELIILSPYIKLNPLKLLIEKVPPGIKIVVVAKWKLSDLVFGSSDIEVFEHLKNLNHGFFINKKIHLKVLVKDKKEILIGSANITGSGLGLFENSNIEAIAIDNLDEKYLPDVYSILRESILVDEDLVEKISRELEAYKEVKSEQDVISKELEKLEDSIFIKSKNNVLVNDFLFTLSPELFLNNIKVGDLNDSTKHDLKILGLKDTDINTEILKQAFLKSNAYFWQLEYINGKVLFGKYSELLHNALVDDPKPYRKQVKELVESMFNWTKEFSNEFNIIKYEYSSSMIRK